MNTKNRIKIFLTLAVVLSISATAMAMSVPAKPLGATGGNMYTLVGVPVQVDLHITDAVTDVNDLSFRWDSTYYDDPNFVKTYTQLDPEDPNVWEISFERPEGEETGTRRYDIYCYVTDDNGEVKSSVMRIYEYDDACVLAKGFNPDAVIPTDLNGDCITNLADVAILAAAWMKDTTPTEPFLIGG